MKYLKGSPPISNKAIKIRHNGTYSAKLSCPLIRISNKESFQLPSDTYDFNLLMVTESIEKDKSVLEL